MPLGCGMGRVRLAFSGSNAKVLVEKGHGILTPDLHARKKRYKKVKQLFFLAASDSLSFHPSTDS